MKRLFAIVAMLLMSFGLFPYVPKVKASLSSGTLADAMNTIITANSWVPTSNDAYWTVSSAVAHYATVFSVGNPSYYQTAAENDLASSNPVQALHDKRMAEIDGMPTAVSDATVQSYLSNAPMTGYVPITYSNQYFLIYHRFEAGAYRWAPPSLQSKWNAAGALAEINSIVQSGSPGTYIAYSQSGGYATYYRYYDDTAETIEWFLEVGGNSYMSTCDQIWNFQQSYFWNGQYYGYSSQSGMETEVGPFALISGRYLVTKGDFATYGDRIVSDLNQKLLISGYSSPLWNHYSLNHVPGYDERRLENAAAAWAAMEAYYPVMTPTMQTTLQGMGSVGWRGLLDQSGDFDSGTNMFRIWASVPTTMGATGVGLMVMFMNGIVPKTGSLAIPLNDESYEDMAGWSPATMFRFDYANRQIRIPVNAGTLNFIFGSGTASYTFPSTGVYQVQFSSDWNTVQSATLIAPLDSGFKYITPGSTPSQATLSVSAQDTLGQSLTGASITVDGTMKLTPVTVTLALGSHTVMASSTFGSYTFVNWSDGWTAATRTVSLASDMQLTAIYSITNPPPRSAVYIRADGSVDPPTAPIQRNGSIYTFAGNVTSDGEGINIQKNNVIVDGAGYTVRGSGSECGFNLSGINYVTIENVEITNFRYGIYLEGSSNISICGNGVANNVYGVWLNSSSDNSIYHTNFVNNTQQVVSFSSINMWDNGYPSGGNYWSYYSGVDSNQDGIGDTPYVIDANNNDSYPLMGPWTRVGEDVTVTHATGVSLTFAEVTSTGITTVAETQSGLNAPSGFKLALEPPTYYDIKTTASYSGTIKLSIPYDDTGLTEEQENGLWLVHWDETLQQWVEVTISVDTESNVIYGETSHLSVFTLIRPLHNIAITNANPSKTVVGQGYSLNTNVIVANQGDYTETFNVTVLANTTIIASQTVTLLAGNSTTVAFTWNTASFAKGNYTINAFAWPVLNETDTADNNFTGGWVVVSMVGDLTGGSANAWDFVPDGVVDGSDLSIVSKCFGSWPGAQPPMIWNANCDVNNDGVVDGSELSIVARHFGEGGP
jgi:parallel beta-helix repeat protein